jgi:hypothetical protein
MRRCAIILITAALMPLLFAPAAQARPVSYPGGWTLMLRNDAFQNSAHVHYTLDPAHSVGLRVRYDRGEDFTFTGAQLNRLMKRWNAPDSQANLYFRLGAGQAVDNIDRDDLRVKRASDGAVFLGLSGDWETRRYFVSASAEYWDNGRFGDASNYHARLGIAPYVANTGALHSWIMVEGHHRPESDGLQSEDNLGASLILRLFKGPSLLELGVDDQGEALLNYIHRF